MTQSMSFQQNKEQTKSQKQDISILIVDDTVDNLRLLIRILSEEGYHIRPATDGETALRAARLDPPDLILLDIKMPGMSGYDVCAQLKADPTTQAIPVIFLTVLDDVVDIVKGFELGGVDYITKPVRTGELLIRINNQVKLRSLQRKLQEQTDFLKTIYDTVEASISVLDITESGRFQIADVNKTALRMSGLTREQMIGTYVDQLLSAEVIERNHKRCLETQQPVEREEPVELHGETTWWLSTHTPLRNAEGEIVQMLGTGINITERKRAETALSERTVELSQALESLKQTQETLIQSKKMAALGNLVAGVAHEINTPVGTALMSASTLQNASQDIAADLASDQLKRSSFEQYIEIATECSALILNNLQRAGELVRTFKQVAVDQSSLQQRTFVLKSYLQEVIDNLMPRLRRAAHTITLTGSDDIEMVSYPGAIAQVVTNLIDNVLTHAYPGQEKGTISIDLQQQADRVIVCFSDDGIGIAESIQMKVFEPFYTTARDRGGSGLGLHLVYNLVTQKLQGSIELRSSDRSGTTFVLDLPVRIDDTHPIG